MQNPKYFITGTRCPEYVQANLLTPPTHERTLNDCGFGFRGAFQLAPYGVDLKLTYQIDTKWPVFDNYPESKGFELYSKKLIGLMTDFNVKFEYFSARMVDEKGNELTNLEYYTFHLLEDLVDAMDEKKSEWKEEIRGIPRLVLDYSKFEHKPYFILNKIFIPLVREDLKNEIVKRKITGFGFLSPEKYRSGKYGLPPDFND